MNSIFQESMVLLQKINEEGFEGFRPDINTGQMLRPRQVEALRKILFLMYDQNKKFVSLTAPTGSGKSVIGAVLAKIANELEGSETNLTTSSRALQTQYGTSLKVDEDFKVVMGTSNYKCSFFKDNKTGARFTASDSPCRSDNAIFDEHWSSRKPVKKRREGGIYTIHDDQDVEVISSVDKRVDKVGEDMENLKDTMPSNSKLYLYKIKGFCDKSGVCSFYRARNEASKAPVAIRSIQHLLFYIMYQVGGETPVLQARELHIHDESHSIESVFREFFSVNFSELSYQSTMLKINEEYSGRGSQINIIKDFSKLKQSPGFNWSESDVRSACVAIEENFASAIEKTAMAFENTLRSSDKIANALDFLKSMADARLRSDPDMIDPNVRTVIRWYKNLHTANQDHERYLQYKAKNQRYEKRYGAEIKFEKNRKASINVYPISLEGMGDRYFGTRNTLFMSATPLSPNLFEKMFGLVGQVGHVEIESDFPTERSPIFYDPVVTNTHDGAKALGMSHVKSDVKERDIEAYKIGSKLIHESLSKRIVEIANNFNNLSGIIPCASYTSVQLLKDCIQDDRFIFATEASQNVPSIKDFKTRSAAGESVFLVSAGISEGHSFDDSVSRIQILTKYPYPARDSVMLDLCKRWGESYYSARTAMVLQQMSGRSMRSASDWCVTIMLDKKFEMLKNEKVQKYYSKHFIKCLNWDSSWEDYVQPTDS